MRVRPCDFYVEFRGETVRSARLAHPRWILNDRAGINCVGGCRGSGFIRKILRTSASEQASGPML